MEGTRPPCLVLDLRGLGTSRYARRWALQGVSFKVSRGQGFGVLGANGMGKTTLLSLLLGIVLGGGLALGRPRLPPRRPLAVEAVAARLGPPLAVGALRARWQVLANQVLQRELPRGKCKENAQQRGEKRENDEYKANHGYGPSDLS